MADQPDVANDVPWRKRHPLVSRLLLYVLGLGLVVLLVLLLVERQEVDERDRMDALAKELDNLGLVHALDEDGSEVLRLLDDKFSNPDLPPQLRGRALRWRAMALRKRADRDAVERTLEAAASLGLEPTERMALQLEWAEARLEAGDGPGAIAALPDERTVAREPVFGLLRALMFARARSLEGDRATGLPDLREALAALEAPLPSAEAAGMRRYVGGDDWTLVQVATIATQVLAKEGAASRAPEAWRRLQRLAPRDFDALLACTRGFLDLRLDADARAAWEQVRALDPARARQHAGRDPVLAALED